MCKGGSHAERTHEPALLCQSAPAHGRDPILTCLEPQGRLGSLAFHSLAVLSKDLLVALALVGLEASAMGRQAGVRETSQLC